jgi:hypothetical protein
VVRNRGHFFLIVFVVLFVMRRLISELLPYYLVAKMNEDSRSVAVRWACRPDSGMKAAALLPVLAPMYSPEMELS